jgi:3-oxoacyl-[acyl-carrier protein] reductase
MDLQLKGLQAIVTGGTKGIGRAIAQTFAAEGADVALCARNANEVAQTISDFSHYGVKIVGEAVDVSDASKLREWVAEVDKSLGGIDIVVANVSTLAISNNEDGWQRGFNVDMMGTVRLINAAMPSLERSRKPAIVTISSASGREIDFASGPYGAFKAAIVHYTQGLAYHLAAKGSPAASFITGTNLVVDGALTKGVQL